MEIFDYYYNDYSHLDSLIILMLYNYNRDKNHDFVNYVYFVVVVLFPMLLLLAASAYVFFEILNLTFLSVTGDLFFLSQFMKIF